MTAIFVLMYTQFIAYMSPVITKGLFVSSDIDVESKVEMAMTIVFPKAPCTIIDMQISTGYTTLMRQDLEKDFRFTRIKGQSGD